MKAFLHTVKLDKIKLVIAVLAAASLMSTSAWATDYLITPDRPFAVSGGVTTVLAGDGLLMDIEARRSYVCAGIPSDSASTFAFGLDVVPTLGGTTLTARAIGNLAPKITAAVSSTGRARISFTTSTAGGRFRVNVDSAKDGGEPILFHCGATTLFGVFNTLATVHPNNFVELRNLSNRTITAVLTLENPTGGVVGTETVDIGAFRRTDIAVHDLAPNTFGIVRVTHNGPSKRLRGEVAIYDAASGGALILRATRPLLEAQE